MTEGIKPCPFCGSDAVQLVLSFSSWFVRCNECDATGPSEDDTSDGDRKAIDSWNVPDRKSQLSGVAHFCEFTGDADHTWDEPGYKKLCQHAGYEHCMLHGQPLTQQDGWRVCCYKCSTPVQVKHIGKGKM